MSAAAACFASPAVCSSALRAPPHDIPAERTAIGGWISVSAAWDSYGYGYGYGYGYVPKLSASVRATTGRTLERDDAHVVRAGNLPEVCSTVKGRTVTVGARKKGQSRRMTAPASLSSCTAAGELPVATLLGHVDGYRVPSVAARSRSTCVPCGRRELSYVEPGPRSHDFLCRAELRECWSIWRALDTFKPTAPAGPSPAAPALNRGLARWLPSQSRLWSPAATHRACCSCRVCSEAVLRSPHMGWLPPIGAAGVPTLAITFPDGITRANPSGRGNQSPITRAARCQQDQLFPNRGPKFR